MEIVFWLLNKVLVLLGSLLQYSLLDLHEILFQNLKIRNLIIHHSSWGGGWAGTNRSWWPTHWDSWSRIWCTGLARTLLVGWWCMRTPHTPTTHWFVVGPPPGRRGTYPTTWTTIVRLCFQFGSPGSRSTPLNWIHQGCPLSWTTWSQYYSPTVGRSQEVGVALSPELYPAWGTMSWLDALNLMPLIGSCCLRCT